MILPSADLYINLHHLNNQSLQNNITHFDSSVNTFIVLIVFLMCFYVFTMCFNKINDFLAKDEKLIKNI